MNYEPGAPCVKVFFFLKSKDCRRIFEAHSGLKSRGLGDFGSPSGREEISESTYEASAVLDKFFDSEHYVKT